MSVLAPVGLYVKKKQIFRAEPFASVFLSAGQTQSGARNHTDRKVLTGVSVNARGMLIMLVLRMTTLIGSIILRSISHDARYHAHTA